MKKEVKIVREKINGGGEAVYGLGLIGALFYFIQQSQTFTELFVAIIKSLLWPAFVVYHILEFLKI